jgi:hypothetical protein
METRVVSISWSRRTLVVATIDGLVYSYRVSLVNSKVSVELLKMISSDADMRLTTSISVRNDRNDPEIQIAAVAQGSIVLVTLLSRGTPVHRISLPTQTSVCTLTWRQDRLSILTVNGRLYEQYFFLNDGDIILDELVDSSDRFSNQLACTKSDRPEDDDENDDSDNEDTEETEEYIVYGQCTSKNGLYDAVCYVKQSPTDMPYLQDCDRFTQLVFQPFTDELRVEQVLDRFERDLQAIDESCDMLYSLWEVCHASLPVLSESFESLVRFLRGSYVFEPNLSSEGSLPLLTPKGLYCLSALVYIYASSRVIHVI